MSVIFLMGLLLFSAHQELDGMNRRGGRGVSEQPTPETQQPAPPSHQHNPYTPPQLPPPQLPPRIFYAYYSYTLDSSGTPVYLSDIPVYLDDALTNIYIKMQAFSPITTQPSFGLVVALYRLQYTQNVDGTYNYYYTNTDESLIYLTRAHESLDIKLP